MNARKNTSMLLRFFFLYYAYTKDGVPSASGFFRLKQPVSSVRGL